MRISVFMAAAVIGLAVPCWAHKAVTSFSPPSNVVSRADAGDTSAMIVLGNIYLIRADETNDYANTSTWFKRAADAGNVDAMMCLYNLYAFKLRDQPDADHKARQWMAKATSSLLASANKGDITAQLHLAYLCGLGGGCDQMTWYRKAAAAGSAQAMEAIGNHYHIGWDVPNNPVKAVQWLRKAAAAGNVKAMEDLESIYAQGDGVPRDPDQARTWKIAADMAERKKAQAGNTAAMIAVAVRDLHDAKHGVGKLEEAMDLLTRAAEAGSYQAAVTLALEYSRGVHLPLDPKQAQHWRDIAAKIGLPLDRFPWPEEY